MTAQEPDLLAEVDARCAHGVYEPDYCERCEEPGTSQAVVTEYARLVAGGRYELPNPHATVRQRLTGRVFRRQFVLVED